MGGDISAARSRKRVGRLAIPERLQAVAITTAFRAIIEEERGSWAGGKPGAQRPPDGESRFIEFHDDILPLPLREGGGGRGQRRALHKPPLRHEPLHPPPTPPDELPDRQRIEE